ncbi:MAG TPA: hypothetical protein VL119_03225 [Acidimicrobiia bacterium]|nr:hypothetical protein [Acidimicrobiia bacterium]
MTTADDDDRVRAEANGSRLLAEGAEMLTDGVARLGGAWITAAVARVADAWGGLDRSARATLDEAAAAAAERGAARVLGELRELFALDPAAQRSTPLEIMRSLRREPTEVLRGAGIPGVVRDPFDERAFPDDVYGIVLRSPTELGDDELGGALLAWGLGKAKILEARAEGRGRRETEL